MNAWIDARPAEKRWTVLSLVALVLLTADVVTGGPLTHADEWVRVAAQPRPEGAPEWLAAAGALGDLGVASALLAIAGVVAAQYSWRLWPVVLAGGNFVVTEASVLALKAAVGRPGPGVGAERADYPGYFPSGHTATAAVCTGTIVFLLMTARGHAKPSERTDRAASMSLVVGVVLGAAAALHAFLEDHHWMTDGLGGLLVAVIVLTTGFAMCRAFLGAPSSVGNS